MKKYKIKYLSGSDICIKYVSSNNQGEALAWFYTHVSHTDIISIEVVEDEV